jgi:CRISPR-associated protein Csc2
LARKFKTTQLSEDELKSLIEDVNRHWSEAERDNFLKRLDKSYQPFRLHPAEKNGKSKSKKTPVETES